MQEQPTPLTDAEPTAIHNPPTTPRMPFTFGFCDASGNVVAPIKVSKFIDKTGPVPVVYEGPANGDAQ